MQELILLVSQLLDEIAGDASDEQLLQVESSLVTSVLVDFSL